MSQQDISSQHVEHIPSTSKFQEHVGQISHPLPIDVPKIRFLSLELFCIPLPKLSIMSPLE
jgi:hypothetical protein